jgi:hypothetical protein
LRLSIDLCTVVQGLHETVRCGALFSIIVLLASIFNPSSLFSVVIEVCEFPRHFGTAEPIGGKLNDLDSILL